MTIYVNMYVNTNVNVNVTWYSIIGSVLSNRIQGDHGINVEFAYVNCDRLDGNYYSVPSLVVSV